jgi:hypothetical protein
MVSCVRFPFLSGLPAIFQVFFAFLTSFPHLGHFAIYLDLCTWIRMYVHKTFSIGYMQKTESASEIACFCGFNIRNLGKPAAKAGKKGIILRWET